MLSNLLSHSAISLKAVSHELMSLALNILPHIVRHGFFIKVMLLLVFC